MDRQINEKNRLVYQQSRCHPSHYPHHAEHHRREKEIIMKVLKAIISVYAFLFFNMGIHPNCPPKDRLIPSIEKTGILTTQVILERSRSEEGKSYVGIRDITMDESSALYAFDYMNYKIQKYDREGKPLLAFGGTGNEDGKFSHLAGIKAVGSRILAVDFSGLSLFDSEGKFLNKHPYEKEVRVEHPAIFDDGRFVGSHILAEELKTALILRDTDGKELSRLASYDIREFFPDIKDGEDFYLDDTYARAYRYTISLAGDILWAASDAFEIYRFSKGESRLIIEEKATAVPFPDELRKPLLDRQSRIKPPFFSYVPDKYPIVYHLLCGPDGDVWVYARSRERTGFLRYSKQGKLLGVYAVESDFDMMQAIVRIFNGSMYFLVNERDGVKIYSAVLPGRTS